MMSVKKRLVVSESYKIMYLSRQEKFEDTKGVILTRNSKDRQYNEQQKNDKKTNNDRHNTTHKIKDRATRLTKNHVWTQVSRKGSSCTTSDTLVLLQKRYKYHLS